MKRINRLFKQISRDERISNFFRTYHKLSYIHNTGENPLKPLTIGQLIERTCVEHGNTLAVISCHQQEHMTYRALLDEADRLAAGLTRMGFQKGDKVGLWAPNMLEWYVTFMACARGGFVMVSMNPYYQKNELQYSINKVGISVLVTREKNLKKQDFYGVLQSVCPEISESEPGKIRSCNVPTLRSVITIGNGKQRGTHTYDEVLDFANEESVSSIRDNQRSIKIDDPCCIQFTSGTTGLSKAPALSHFSMVNNGFFIGKRNKFGQKQHILCIPNPLFHAFGTVIGLLASLNYGTTVVLPSDVYNVETNLEMIKTHQCTVIYGTPTMHVDLVNLQKKKKEKLHLEIALSGGAICTPQLFKDMLEVLGVKEVKSVYGLTETTGSSFHTLDGDDEYKCTRTVGYLQEHLEAKVIDEQGNIVPRGTAGELCIRGYAVMLNYCGDEDKTKESKEPNGWFHTGDLAVINEEGYAEIVGRLKDMIIRGGENIYPREIEDYLNTHPDILETHVIGLPHERLGEEVCACLKMRDNAKMTVEDIRKFCLGTIATYKIPTSIKILTSFPLTASGKVQKLKLVELLTKK